jgi:hypothetical protein
MPIDQSKRDLAVFTIVQDEPEFIHPWINHYKKHVLEACDLHVLVHAPTAPDGRPMAAESVPSWHRALSLITSHHNATVIPVHHSAAFDHRWLADTVARFQAFLLSSYSWVLFAEADEFVLQSPGRIGGGTLLDLIRLLGDAPPPAVRASGFEVVQQPEEPGVAPRLYNDGSAVDLSAADLMQECRFWHRSEAYSKTLLANIPLRWEPGFHKTDMPHSLIQSIATGAPSPLLVLVHLHKVDFNLALCRSRRARARKWSSFDLERRLGLQNYIDDVAELRAYWNMDAYTANPLDKAALEQIDEGVRQALR